MALSPYGELMRLFCSRREATWTFVSDRLDRVTDESVVESDRYSGRLRNSSALTTESLDRCGQHFYDSILPGMSLTLSRRELSR